MVPHGIPALVSLLFFGLLNSVRVSPGSAARIENQKYAKMRASSRFLLGVQVAGVSSSAASRSRCAALCQDRGCQSFEFGFDDDDAATEPGEPVCRIYKNVAPRLADEYFENKTRNDYYEMVVALPPQKYKRCTPGPLCVGDVFCGKAVKRVSTKGYYVLAVRNVCYSIYLNASDALNWNKSRTACGYFNGKLVEPADWEEQTLLVGLINRLSAHPNFKQSGSPAPASVWMGCSGNAEWKWLDGSNVTTFFWDGTNPDRNRDVNCCGSLYTDPTKKTFWIDRNCMDNTARVCVYEYAA